MAQTDERVDAIAEEFRDRFGAIPDETTNLFWLIRLKNLLKRVGIEGLAVSGNRTSITVRKTSLIEIDEVMKLYAGPKSVRDPRVQITPDSKIVFLIPFENLKSHLFELEKFLERIAPKAFDNQKSR